jgi:hypothetical protein
MHQPSDADPDLVADAVAYVTRLYEEVKAEHGPPRSGAGQAVVAMILEDPTLSAYVRRWARHAHRIEQKVGTPDRLPVDPVHRRLRDALLRLCADA